MYWIPSTGIARGANNWTLNSGKPHFLGTQKPHKHKDSTFWFKGNSRNHGLQDPYVDEVFWALILEPKQDRTSWSSSAPDSAGSSPAGSSASRGLKRSSARFLVAGQAALNLSRHMYDPIAIVGLVDL